MASQSQTKYIEGLAVKKTKEFKEVKELLLASGIVGDKPETVLNAQSLAEISYALTDSQASRFIDVLISHKTPVRERVYSKRRVEKTISALDSIKSDIDGWAF